MCFSNWLSFGGSLGAGGDAALGLVVSAGAQRVIELDLGMT